MPHPPHCFLHPSATSYWVPIFSLETFSQIPLPYVLPLMTECKFHIHIKEQATYKSFMYFNVHILIQETTRHKMQTYCLFSYCPSCRHINMTCDLRSVCQSVCSWDKIFCYIYGGSQQTWIYGTALVFL
jgi:elongation factor P hydroxylase